MQNELPLTRDLVLVGGGHAHALVLRKWGMNPLPGARLTVINPGPTAPYTGMLPGHVAGHYDRDALEIDLVRLCRYAGARLILSHATDIDTEARLVHVQGRGPIAYDVASIDVGITAQMPDIPGFQDHAVGAKPLDVFARRWRGFLQSVAQGDATPKVAVIGGGVAGVELAMAMAHALRGAAKAPEVTVLESGPQISGVGDRARARLMAAMAEQCVTLRTNVLVSRITPQGAELNGDEICAADLVVGAAGAFPHEWIAKTGLPLTDGFITVDETLGVVGFDNLFAVGDCSHMSASPRPKAGVFAVRAAPVLNDNLKAALRGARRRPFNPQKHYLKLISLGGQSALAEKYGRVLAGPVLWRWKDRIDRTFMDRLNDLPAMPPPPLPKQMAAGVSDILNDVPLCGGCGAKVGGDVLVDALANVAAPNRPDIVSGPGDDAAILTAGQGFQVISTDHLRGFVLDADLVARIAAIHALGDIWSMGAAPQSALATVILPRMSSELQRRTMREITDAASNVFGDEGAALVGGHSTMGAELTVGFTVTGTRDTMPISQDGAQVGDVLILTKPIGTGVLLAGEMAGVADGRDVARVLKNMCRPQGAEANALSKAHAMTDVTGFGLAGHLMAMCRASGVGADLNWANVPIYSGAAELSDKGVKSAIYAANALSAPVIGTAHELLHDPQTSGGLLAALAPKDAEDAVQAMRAQGLEVSVIGQITDQSGQIQIL